MDQQHTDFLKAHSEENFGHSEELIQGLASGSWFLTSYTGGEKNRMQAQTFVEIYGKKARQLTHADDEYSKTLQNELIDFCKVMEKLGEDIIDVWSFTDEVSFINVFVQRKTEKVVASLKTKS